LADTTKSGSAGAPGLELRRPPLALSSGQAARYCLVSPGTIANWIADGHLSAQRTRGGRFRILVDDLRRFMTAHGMQTAALDNDFALRPTCWEFWASLDRSRTPGACGLKCAECPVYRSGARVCHVVRPLLPGGTLRARSCKECVYLIQMRGMEDDET
jgi:excisionase family DNA binding protein